MADDLQSPDESDSHMVAKVGLEPTSPFGRLILNQLRLPISPLGHIHVISKGFNGFSQVIKEPLLSSAVLLRAARSMDSRGEPLIHPCEWIRGISWTQININTIIYVILGCVVPVRLHGLPQLGCELVGRTVAQESQKLRDSQIDFHCFLEFLSRFIHVPAETEVLQIPHSTISNPHRFQVS